MANSPASAQHDDDVLRDGFELGFTYTRSVGPVIGAFLTGLRDGKIVRETIMTPGRAAREIMAELA